MGIAENLSSQEWRLNNLYYVKDENGQRVKFRLRDIQEKFYRDKWYLNLILKARQMGMTTFIQIYMLDCCLFYSNKSAGVIAQGREYAEDFFEDKIKYAYDNLPGEIKRLRPSTSDSARELSFSNGSKIRVGTSLRSGTYQYLHISEFGKICSERPDRAKEIVTGALNTVHTGQEVFIESTAEGDHGYFYEMVMESMLLNDHTPMDYKLHFFPWYDDAKYALDTDIALSDEEQDYFARLEQKTGRTITYPQRAWYVKKKATQKDDMTREYPSTPEEAFKQTNRHAIYGEEFKTIYKEERICSVPYDSTVPVHLFYDLGRSKTDATCIWFMQDKRGRHQFIDYYQNIQKPVAHYYKVIQERGYVIGTWYLPHDGDTNDFDMEDYEDKLRNLGAVDVQVVPRVSHINLGIQAVREALPKCWFDEEKCADGLKGLQNYRYAYDEKLATHKAPLHNWASHPADAFRTYAQGYEQTSGFGDYFAKNENMTRRERKRQPKYGRRVFV